MFCPNCAAQNEPSQHYCRICGLKLDAIVAEMSLQKPSAEMADLLKKQKWMQRLGIFSLSTAGFIGLALLFAQVIYYKLMILGPALLFGSAIGAVILFLLASVFFFSYSRFFMKLDRADTHFPGRKEISIPTGKLLDDPPFNLQPSLSTQRSFYPENELCSDSIIPNIHKLFRLRKIERASIDRFHGYFAGNNQFDHRG